MANGTGDGLTGAGITPKERLERIEAMLERIDAKLDAKANESDVVALELRVRDMELELSSFDGVKKEHEEIFAELAELRQKVFMATGGLVVLVFLVEVIAKFVA